MRTFPEASELRCWPTDGSAGLPHPCAMTAHRTGSAGNSTGASDTLLRGARAPDAAAQRDLARVMLKGAVWAFREELRKGACEQRVAEARAAVIFWRERLEALLGQPLRRPG